MKKLLIDNKIYGYPISYAQRRMWFLSKIETEKLLNNTGIIATFFSDFNLDYLEKSFNILIDRNEGFRTNFIQATNGEVIQIIHAKRELKISFFDISQQAGKVKNGLEKKIINQNIEKKFNLDTDLLLRISLIKLSEKKYTLVICNHHIISDVWTLAFLWNDLSHIYESQVNNLIYKLPKLTFQYKDYSSWEQTEEFLSKYRNQKSYWVKKLKGVPAMLKLPIDMTRPAVQTYNNCSLEQALNKSFIYQIEKVCAHLNVTLYTFFLAIFIILLNKLSGEEDVVVGAFVANRDQTEMERVAGILLNNLAIRVRLNKPESFQQFILEVNKTVLEAMNNKEYPFEKLIDDLAIERDASHPPLFNTVFQIFNKDIGLLKNSFPNQEKKVKFFNSNFFQYDLVFRIWVEEKEITLNLNYNIDLFKDKTARLIIDAYQKLLNIVVHDYKQEINQVEIFSDLEKKEFSKNKKNNCPHILNGEKQVAVNNRYKAIEKDVIQIWQSVLGVKKIQRNDSFFSLGGHSLKLIQVFDKLNLKYPGEITVAQLFNYFTVASLAEYLGNIQKNDLCFVKKNNYKKEVSDLLDNVKSGQVDIETAVETLNNL